MSGRGSALCLALALGALGCWDGLLDWLPLPSDREMHGRFQSHFDTLETLARMADEDAHMARIDSEFLWRADNVQWPRPEAEYGITQARWNEYRRLFAEADCPQGISREEFGVFVICASRGMVGRGALKGFAKIAEPTRIFEYKSLDGDPRPRPACRQLRDAWFLCVAG